MWSFTKPLATGNTSRRVRIWIGALLAVLLTGSLLTTALLQTQVWLYQQDTSYEPVEVMPFPLGVDPHNERITEQPNVSGFLYTQFAHEPKRPDPPSQTLSWLQRTWRRLAQSAAVQHLASPVTRIVVIWPGDRREEVVDNFGDILGWNERERQRFQTTVTEQVPGFDEGVFFPGKYIVSVDIAPETMAALVNQRFKDAIGARYTPSIEVAVPLKDTLIIASLLEREAYDFTDMREISGIIWNRLFADMHLQLDASLQYAKGSRPYGPWWPRVRPTDKYLDSPFNTYRHSGLPPEPIANPSPEAVLAALNPRDTDCLFYFHDSDGGFHCSASYEEHVGRLKQLYGRGK